MQYLHYRRYAIELDGTHAPDKAGSDETRDMDLAAENFEVISLRPNERGYFPEVQKLVEKIAVEMADADKSAGDLATDVENATYTQPQKVSDDDIPF